MRSLRLLTLIAALSCLCCTAQAYVVTFDDVPAGMDFGSYYWKACGIALDSYFLEIVDHTGSTWGPPNSGANVAVLKQEYNPVRIDTMFKGQPVWDVYSFGAFFSTQQDAVLKMVGYDGSLDHPVSTVYIGAPGQSLHNQYFEVSSLAGNIGMVEIYPVSTDAFHKFCLDDITVVPVPEPSSIAALGVGLLPLGMALRRRLCK